MNSRFHRHRRIDWNLKKMHIADGDGILHTEDGIPVETIYVRNITSEVTEKELKEYFEDYGNVVSVCIKRSGGKYASYYYAFVTFSEPQSATKVLRHEGLHYLLGNRMKVNAANSWSQPKQDEFYKFWTKNDPSKDEETYEDQFSILNLNDDCLLHIASFLDLSDLLNLSNTCKRLEHVSNVTFASCKRLDVHSFANLTPMTVRVILAKIGPHVQEITCRTLRGGIRKCIQFLPKYCSNVKFLDFTLIESFPDSFYKKIIRTFKNLKTLTLQHCPISDDVCAALCNCGDLETLNLSENPKITGRHLDKLANLQTLNLKCCSSLEPMFFEALCMKTKLVSLNIEKCDLLNDSAIGILASTQVKLEDLSISSTYMASNLLPLTTLKSLKRLSVHCDSTICDDFFRELAKHRGAELEMLAIMGISLNENVKEALYKFKNLKELSISKCTEIDSLFFTRMAESAPLEYFSSVERSSVCNEDILNLIRFSDTIKKINITLCKQSYRSLVTSAVEILKTKKINEPLTLLVNGTNITPVKMDEAFILNNRHLINLKFDLISSVPCAYDENGMLFSSSCFLAE